MKNSCVAPHPYSELPGLIESRLEKRAIGFSHHRPFVGQGMLEDSIMEARHNPPPDTGELLGEARREWQALQEATHRVVAGLVTALALMQERRRMPAFSLKLETDR